MNKRRRHFAGLQMKGGATVSQTPLRLRPTIQHACTDQPTFLRLYTRYLRSLDFLIPDAVQGGAYQRFTGDSSVPGKGEVLVWQPT
jgi:hypothetical protein